MNLKKTLAVMAAMSLVTVAAPALAVNPFSEVPASANGAKFINPGTSKKTITFIDNVVYSKVTDLDGNPLELKMSLMMREPPRGPRAKDPKEHLPKPVLVWVPGGGWRGADKNLMIGEMTEFANAGYLVASIYYRNSAQGHFPDQLIDVKTAIRFLRAHAEKYEIDPDHIGIFGRSAGGHLTTFAAMNVDDFEGDEWSGYSSKIQAACDMFGPVDLVANMEIEEKKFSDPKFPWHKLEETHGGAFVGGDPATMKERAKAASPINYVNDGMCPLLILHGDSDPIVPRAVSSDLLYARLVEAGLNDRADYYVLENASHGSPEFFQDSTKALMLDFFDKNLKK